MLWWWYDDVMMTLWWCCDDVMMLLWWCYDDIMMMLWWYDDVMMILWWCYADVMVMLWWCYDDVVMMLWWYYDDVMMILWWCYGDDMMMLWWGYDDVILMLWWCYDDVMMMLWWCYDDVMMIFYWCYDDVMMMFWWCYDDVMVMIWLCYDDVMMMLWWCYDDVMMMLWWCYDDVMVMIWWCYDDVMMILWWCYDDVMMMLWWCFGDDMMMLWWCYDDVTMMLWWCYDDVMMMLWWCYGVYPRIHYRVCAVMSYHTYYHTFHNHILSYSHELLCAWLTKRPLCAFFQRSVAYHSIADIQTAKIAHSTKANDREETEGTLARVIPSPSLQERSQTWPPYRSFGPCYDWCIELLSWRWNFPIVLAHNNWISAGSIGFVIGLHTRTLSKAKRCVGWSVPFLWSWFIVSSSTCAIGFTLNNLLDMTCRKPWPKVDIFPSPSRDLSSFMSRIVSSSPPFGPFKQVNIVEFCYRTLSCFSSIFTHQAKVLRNTIMHSVRLHPSTLRFLGKEIHTILDVLSAMVSVMVCNRL